MIQQVRNPITDRWLKIDTRTGCIVVHKKSPGPYKGIQKFGQPLKVSFLSKKKIPKRVAGKKRVPPRLSFLARR